MPEFMLLLLLRLLHAVHLTISHAASILCVLSARRSSPQHLMKVPVHVGIVAGACGEQQALRQLSKLIGWCADLGVRYITLCDVYGEIVHASRGLRSELRADGVNACVLDLSLIHI